MVIRRSVKKDLFSRGFVLLASVAMALAGGRASASTYTVLHSFPTAPRNPETTLVSDGLGNFYGTSEGTLLGPGSTIFRVRADGTDLTILRWFAGGSGSDAVVASVTLDGAGNLFGMTIRTGAVEGTIFRMKIDGTGYTTLHSFAGGADDGGQPLGALTIDTAAGYLYGTTVTGGSSNAGTVFQMNVDGSDFSVMHSFGSSLGDGAYPYAPPIFDAKGRLYGTTQQGGPNGLGTVFTIRSDGSSYSILHGFSGTANDGEYPSAPLVADGSGRLFGVALGPGSPDLGIIYSLKTNGSDFGVLHSLSGASDGSHTYTAGLLFDSTGVLFGTTPAGGANNLGVIFSVNTNGSGFSVLHEFSDSEEDGATPIGGLTSDGSSGIYGTSFGGGSHGYGSVYSLNEEGNGFTLLNSFYDKADDGDQGSGCALAQDGSGELFVTAGLGGSHGGGIAGKLTVGGAGYSEIHSFEMPIDGANPGMALDASGNVYGTTGFGGPGGFGTVFKMKSDGSSFATVHSFAGGAADGARPYSPLVQDGSGYLYGTTNQGGAANKGTVFRIKVDGSGFAILHSFAGGPNDGDGPVAPLVLDGSGTLYGVTGQGGASNTGIVFKLRTNGAGFNLLHSISDASFPDGLVLDASGNLFGITTSGGVSNGGTVFKLKTNGTGYAVLYSLGGQNGSGPDSLVLDGNGILYGATRNGGPGNAGAIFTIRTDGTGFALLHTQLDDPNGGTHPSSLCRDGSGNLYGTTSGDGPLGGGVLFKIDQPIRLAPVRAQTLTPVSGRQALGGQRP